MDDPDYDAEKVDAAVLALLWLTARREAEDPAGALGPGEPAAEVWRAWEGFDGGALDRLHAAGLIHDPRSKARSVSLTSAGRARAEARFRDLFGRGGADAGPDG